ncbi:hypothetical protein ACO2Q2_13370 [Dyella sp. KRB-257]|uniref:hypothetical protein n=1 Tax=Dyella sp. KRB-257 TaxID=3400915 RepID=UPI003C06614F
MDNTEPTGQAFGIDPDFDRSERVRLDLPGKGEDSLHFTGWDNLKFTFAGAFLLIGIPASILLLAFGLHSALRFFLLSVLH